jgi:hypothetical protein
MDDQETPDPDTGLNGRQARQRGARDQSWPQILQRPWSTGQYQFRHLI